MDRPKWMPRLSYEWTGFESAWKGGHLCKEAKHGFFYHTAPSEFRKEIEQRGLVPTNEAPVSPWAKKTGPEREQQPHGVYLWDDPTNARGYAYNLEGQQGGGEYPGDRGAYGGEEIFESPQYEEYMEKYPGEKDENGNPLDEDDYYDYQDKYVHQPEPLYDIWKVNTLGYEPQIDPEMAIHHGELSPEEAQQQINDEANKNWKDEPQGYYDPWSIERSEGHRWYVPHTVEPQRLTLHDSIYPKEMTESAAEEEMNEGKQVPNAWHQVPLNEWNQKAQERYVGNPNVMREIDPIDRT